MTGEVRIRVMKYGDLGAIVEIDARVLGKRRPDYWERKVELTERRALASLVAEVGGQVVGFVMADASGWEYGVPDTVGWIDTLGVLPEYQGRGIAREMMSEMVANLKKVGVVKVYTLVDWRSWDMLKFFSSLGFRKGEMINLELDLESKGR